MARPQKRFDFRISLQLNTMTIAGKRYRVDQVIGGVSATGVTNTTKKRKCTTRQ